MTTFLVRRLGFLVFVSIGVTLFIFVLTNIVPADPARAVAGLNAREDQVQAIRKMMGLDKPLPVQYGRYLWGLLHLDFGRSVRTKRPISSDLEHFFPATLELVLSATTIYIVLGLPIGVLAAIRQGSFADRIVRFGTLSAVAIPGFWLALLLQYLFYSELSILPASGRLPIGMTPPQRITGMYVLDSLLTRNWTTLRASLTHLILPTLCLSIRRVAVLARITRRGMLTALHEDYARTARAKGLAERIVVWRHAFRNVLLPVITIIGLQVGWLFNSSLVVERVFSWPGLGWYAVESIATWDFLSIMSAALIVSLSFVFINMTVDVLYHAADPRLRTESESF